VLGKDVQTPWVTLTEVYTASHYRHGITLVKMQHILSLNCTTMSAQI